MDGFSIRPADENDVKPITDMDKICFDLPWSETSFFEEITGNSIAKYIVAEIAGKIVGYAGIWIILDEGHITNVAVHPQFRRQGIAKALVSALIEISEAAGVKVYTLEVRASNKSAVSLYKYFNFEECGIRKEYYEDNNEDAIIMWKI
jgi:ribosomal-protein-alanine N-acetyltransferase